MERAAVAAAEQLADGQADAIDPKLVDGEVTALQAELLAASGAQLADEQRQAVHVACSDRRLVVIVGQAGTGKSTALTGVARAHQAAGRQLIVTSTGAQAAERLTAELSGAGVSAQGYSTVALRAAVARGAVTLSPEVTIVHDEAALASTREQAWLMQAAAQSGARVIEVGDPRQSGAVGAAGLWPQIEHAAGHRGGLVELARIVRAKDAADRRDQARWRAGEHQQALAGYAARGRVIVENTQQRAEDRALEAAHSDRQKGKRALVVVQTSNEALDALNARAQALRVQDGQLGERGVPLAGRPYGLRAGDELVLRAASVHPQLGAVPNGTRGEVLDVAEDGQHATVALADGREASWERSELDGGSARLAYVSHTFPAQGQTVDRAHVIADRLADSNGTYVAITRARERTCLYASAERLDQPADEGAGGGREARLARLVEQLGRAESEVPSISIALAHERQAEREHADQSESAPLRSTQRDQARVERDQAQAELEQARIRLEQAQVERREAAAVMATQPHDQHAALAYADAQRAAEQAQLAAARGEQLTGELAEMGRLARLGEHGRALRAQLGAARERERDALAEQHDRSREADTRQVELDERRREWEARHPGARDRHQTAEREHQLAEQAHQAAEDRYETAQTHELLAATRPPPASQQLTPGVSEPSRVQLGRRPGLGPERSGPTIGR